MAQELSTVTRIHWTAFQRLKAIAEQERRTVPQQIDQILDDWLRAQELREHGVSHHEAK